MAWGTNDTIISAVALSAANATTTSTPIVNLNPGESCIVQLSATWATTATDDLAFVVQTSPNAGTTWDNIPYMSPTIGKVASAVAQIRSIQVYGVKHFRIVATKGATVETVTINATVIKDGISA
jgi:hypothetical protein